MSIPQAIKRITEEHDNSPFYVFAEPSPSTEVITVTRFDFAKAAHRVAWTLSGYSQPTSSGEQPTAPTVGLLANTDTLVYHAAVVGAMCAGLVPFLLWPRLEPKVVVSMLKQTDCHFLLVTETSLTDLIAGIRAELARVDPDYPLRIQEFPSLAAVYPQLAHVESVSEEPEPYPSPPARDPESLAMIMHSSGSTGSAKPIRHIHKTVSDWTEFAMIKEIHHFAPAPFAVGAMGLTPWALSGTFCQLLQPLFGGIAVALYPPVVKSPGQIPIVPTPQNSIEYAQKANSKVMLCFPALLAGWSESPDAVKFLQSMNLVLFGGGALAQAVGDSLVSLGINIRSLYAATEFGAISVLRPRPEDAKDWEYMRFTDRAKPRMISLGQGMFECQFLSWEKHKLSGENLSDTKGYATADIFERHPRKKDLWRSLGRRDDMLTMASGTKIMPVAAEDAIGATPHAVAAIIFKTSSDKLGVLVQPKPNLQSTLSEEGLRDLLWSAVLMGNQKLPKSHQIPRPLLLVTTPDRPLPRAGMKNLISRRNCIIEYEAEISAANDVVIPPATKGRIAQLFAALRWS